MNKLYLLISLVFTISISQIGLSQSNFNEQGYYTLIKSKTTWNAGRFDNKHVILKLSPNSLVFNMKHKHNTDIGIEEYSLSKTSFILINDTTYKYRTEGNYPAETVIEKQKKHLKVVFIGSIGSKSETYEECIFKKISKKEYNLELKRLNVPKKLETVFPSEIDKSILKDNNTPNDNEKVIVSIPSSDILYRDCDNEINILSKNGRDVKVICSGCYSFQKDGDNKNSYIVRVNQGREATLKIDTGKYYYEKRFKILNHPKPQPFIGGKSYEDNAIKRGLIKNVFGLYAKSLSNLSTKFGVTSFNMYIISDDKLVFQAESNGNKLTQEMREAIKKSEVGDFIGFSKIKVKMKTEEQSYYLGGLFFEVIP